MTIKDPRNRELLQFFKAFLCLCGICLAVMLVCLTMLAGYSIFKAISDSQIFACFGGFLGFSIGLLELKLFHER